MLQAVGGERAQLLLLILRNTKRADVRDGALLQAARVIGAADRFGRQTGRPVAF